MTIHGNKYKQGDVVKCILYGAEVSVRLLNNSGWIIGAWEVISEDDNHLRFILAERDML